MPDPAPPSVIARPAATILLLRDDPFEVLMVRRHAKTFFSSALVFPGGMVDADDRSEEWLPLVEGAETLDEDERALRIAAIRETFEEVSILLARLPDGDCASPCETPTTAHFRHVVRASGGKLMLGELAHFGHWVTPDDSPRRYDTHFFLAGAPLGQEAVCDGGETVALEWVTPSEALARADAGERAIMFPTRLNLLRLAESADARAALSTAAQRPPFTVHPRVEVREGGAAVVIPHEAGYGVTEDFHPSAGEGRRTADDVVRTAGRCE